MDSGNERQKGKILTMNLHMKHCITIVNVKGVHNASPI